MALPVNLDPMTFELPWAIEIGMDLYTEVTFDFTQSAYRMFSGSMEIGLYVNDGAATVPDWIKSFALSINSGSYDDEVAQFKIDMVNKITRAIAQYIIGAELSETVPEGVAEPEGIIWPLTSDVVDYYESGGFLVPAPRGLYRAFRVYPAAEYISAADIVESYRGSPIII